MKAIDILDDDKTFVSSSVGPAHAVPAAVWAARLNLKDGAAKAGGEQGSG